VSLRTLFRAVMSGTISAKNDVRFVFTPSCLLEDSCLIYVICVCLRIVVSNTKSKCNTTDSSDLTGLVLNNTAFKVPE
jgi:hypothetical protein